MTIPRPTTILAAIASACLAFGGHPAVAAPVLRGIDLERSTIPELQAAMDHHRLTALELTRFYLARIAALNPELHAVIETSPTALVEAAASDLRREIGRAHV